MRKRKNGKETHPIAYSRMRIRRIPRRKNKETKRRRVTICTRPAPTGLIRLEPVVFNCWLDFGSFASSCSGYAQRRLTRNNGKHFFCLFCFVVLLFCCFRSSLGPSLFDIVQWVQVGFFYFFILAEKARELDRRWQALGSAGSVPKGRRNNRRTNKNKLPLTDKTTPNRSRITTQRCVFGVCLVVRLPLSFLCELC
jgi:hypothetical protein